MGKIRDRLHLHDHEVDERFDKIVEHEGKGAPVREIPEREQVVEEAEKPPIRWMQWLAGAIVLVLAGAMIAVVALQDEGTTKSTYVGDPYAELELIDQAVADYEASNPNVYVADAYAELELIDQAVAASSSRPSTYVADAHAELELIDQAVAASSNRPSTYVADAHAELELIEEAVAG